MLISLSKALTFVKKALKLNLKVKVGLIIFFLELC